jgi:hypothetical protein
MRAILRKLDKRKTLTEQEYKDLLQYIDALFENSLESYKVFFDRYSAVLWLDYSLYIPRFKYQIDDLINYLVYHPDVLPQMQEEANLLKLFPANLHPYLSYLLEQETHWTILRKLSSTLFQTDADLLELPPARISDAVIKYEEGNPYKEIGLKTHFERLARYQFVTRLQSYRYLQRGKASQDKITVLEKDKLGGIYTNKEKSIYYYIFLHQSDLVQAENACIILNAAFYGTSS